MPNFVLGMNGKLYVSSTLFTDITFTMTSADVMGNVRNVTTSLEKGEADITTRDNDGWAATAGTLKRATLEFETVWKPGDAKFEILKDAYLDGTEVAASALDGAFDAGGEGLTGNMVVTTFSRGEELENAMIVSVTMKPSSFTQWYEGSGS